MTVAAAASARRRVGIRSVDRAHALGQAWVVTGEEFGWRGFLLPRLRRLLPPVVAVPVMAVIWGGWHLPMFFVAGSLQAEDDPGQFAAAVFAWSAVHHVLQLDRPSVASAMVFHAAANVTATVLAVDERTRRRLTAVYVGVGALATLAAQRWDREWK